MALNGYENQEMIATTACSSAPHRGWESLRRAINRLPAININFHFILCCKYLYLIDNHYLDYNPP